ncbi:MAG: TrmB family transcriptional regulator, partial [Candidatus Eisenbacteria bacterium]
VRAVSPAELMTTLARRFEANRLNAEIALSRLPIAKADERVYQLQTAEQTFARAREMIGGAKRVVLADLFPDPARYLAGDLAAAAKRGVAVAAILYGKDQEMPGAIVVRSTNFDVVKAGWPGQHLGLVVDAGEHLQALFDRPCKALHQAIWSNSPFLSCIEHSHFVAEMISQRIGAAGVATADPIATKLARLSLTRLKPRGLTDLIKTHSTRRKD